jgi:uncharacterized protein YlxW (UPF0749 family)
MNKPKGSYLAALAAALVFLLAGALLGTVFRFDSIIALGLFLADALRIACFAAVGIIVVVVVVSVVRWRMRLAAAQQSKLPAYSSMSESRRSDPAVLVKELQRLQPKRPLLHDEIAECIELLESSDSKRDKIRELQQLNAQSNLDQVVRTVEDARSAVAQNTTKILNMVTIWDPREARNPAKAQIYGMNRDYIHTYLQKNRQILDQTDILLHTVVKYVGSTSQTDAMSESISSLSEALAGLLRQYDKFDETAGALGRKADARLTEGAAKP